MIRKRKSAFDTGGKPVSKALFFAGRRLPEQPSAEAGICATEPDLRQIPSKKLKSYRGYLRQNALPQFKNLKTIQIGAFRKGSVKFYRGCARN